MTFLGIAGSLAAPNQYVSQVAGTPEVPVGTYVAIAIAAPSVASSNWGSGAVLTCPVTGYYTCSFIVATYPTGGTGSNRQVQLRILRNGAEVLNNGTVQTGDFGSPGMWGGQINSVFTAGENLQFQGRSWQGNPCVVQAQGTTPCVVITFVPTPTYRK